jgi:hypothetical protein
MAPFKYEVMSLSNYPYMQKVHSKSTVIECVPSLFA